MKLVEVNLTLRKRWYLKLKSILIVSFPEKLTKKTCQFSDGAKKL